MSKVVDITGIAENLSKAQRELMSAKTQDFAKSAHTANPQTLKALEKKGLVESYKRETENGHAWRPTSLGISVRAHLFGQTVIAGHLPAAGAPARVQSDPGQKFTASASSRARTCAAALMAAWVRLSRLRRLTIAETCTRTVCSESPSACATWAFDMPWPRCL